MVHRALPVLLCTLFFVSVISGTNLTASGEADQPECPAHLFDSDYSSQYNPGNLKVTLLSTGALVFGTSRGTELYCQDSNRIGNIPAASKLMTAIIALETLTPETTVTISSKSEALDNLSVRPVGLSLGDKHTVSFLVSAIIYKDSSAASLALAEYISLNESSFIARMNDTAISIGMSDTTFSNTSGKTDFKSYVSGIEPIVTKQNSNQYTTLSDVCLLFRYALQVNEFRNIFCNYRNISFLPDGTPEMISNSMVSSLAAYPDLVGIARFSSNEDSTNSCVLALSSSDGFEAGYITKETPNASILSEIELLTQLVYSEYEISELVSCGDMYRPVFFDSIKKTVMTEFGSNVRYVHPVGILYMTEKTVCIAYENIRLPLQKGDPLGIVQFQLEDQSIISAEIVSSENVMSEKSSAFGFIDLIRNNQNLSVLIALVSATFVILLIFRLSSILIRRAKSRSSSKSAGTSTKK